MSANDKPMTVPLIFDHRNGTSRKDGTLVRVTKLYALVQQPDHTAGRPTRFRLEDGLEAGAWLASLNWKIDRSALPALRELAPKAK